MKISIRLVAEVMREDNALRFELSFSMVHVLRLYVVEVQDELAWVILLISRIQSSLELADLETRQSRA